MKRSITLILLLALNLCLFAQTKTHFTASETSSGYINITELYYGFGLGDNGAPYSKFCAGIVNINGYQLAFKRDFMENKLLQAGGGVGYFAYNEGATIPLFADLRLVFTGKQIEPYIYGQGGGMFDIKNTDNAVRMFANGGGGIRYPFNEQLALNFGLGLMVQVGPSLPRDSYISLKLGLNFFPGKK